MIINGIASGPSFLGEFIDLLREDISAEDFKKLRDAVQTWQASQRHQTWTEFATLTAMQAPPQHQAAEVFAHDPMGTFTGFHELIADNPGAYMEGLQQLVGANKDLLRDDWVRTPILTIGEDPLLKMKWDAFLKGQKIYPAEFWAAVQQLDMAPPNTRTESAVLGLDYLSSVDFSDTPDDDLLWLVDGLLPAGGNSILGAKPKVGKTTLAYTLGLAIARGTPFLGRATRQGKVLHVVMEGVRRQEQAIIRRMGTHENHCFRFGLDLPTQVYTTLASTIEKGAFSLVILDTVFRYCPVENSNDYSEVNRAFSKLIQLGQRTGCHIMALHHLRKEAGENVGDDLLGSTNIFGSVDTFFDYRKREEKNEQPAAWHLRTRQRYGDDMPLTSMGIDAETGQIYAGKIVSEQRKEDKRTDVEEAILAAMPSEGTWVAKAGLTKKIEARREDVLAALNAMVRSGLLKYEKVGQAHMVSVPLDAS